MNKLFSIVGVVVFVLVLVWNLAFYRVDQWTQAIVIQLGEPVRTVREPGLYVKIPLIQSVEYFDKRLLLYDAAPKELLTRDKQQLVVDNFARWRIVDPLNFYRTLRNEEAAQSRLDDIVYSNVRENLGRQTLSEIVSGRRAELMSEITRASDLRVRDFGIEIVDVRIKRADLPEKNEQNVFRRMKAERERLAKKFRAEGDEEARKIRSEADKQSKIVMAEANKQSEIARGGGEALVAKIFADAYGRDLEFFELQRTLQAYDEAINTGTQLILSPNSDFLRYLSDIDGNRRDARP
jgi:membrane protease subunit HflC